MSNPNFRYQQSATDLLRLLDLPASYDEHAQQLVHALDERDRELEDYLSRVVRRASSEATLGNGDDHTGTLAWQSMSPALSFPFTKANLRSHLTVGIQSTGWYLNANGGFVAFGVVGVDADANVVVPNVEICRRPFHPDQHNTVLTAGGWDDIAVGVEGAMTLQVIVQVDNIDTSWQSALNGTTSLSAVESM